MLTCTHHQWSLSDRAELRQTNDPKSFQTTMERIKYQNRTAEKSAALILLWSDGYPILRGFRSVAKEEGSNTFPLSSDKKYSNPPHPLSLESPPPHNVDKPNVRR